MSLLGLVAGLLLPPAAGGILGRRQVVRVHDPDCVVEIDIGATVLEQPVAVRTPITRPTTITVGPGATITVPSAPTYLDTIVTVTSTITGTSTRTYTINRSGSGITSTTTRITRPGSPSSTPWLLFRFTELGANVRQLLFCRLQLGFRWIVKPLASI
ncbi:hypothetical protein SLS57_002633 [Botryosphaeria dothidea]